MTEFVLKIDSLEKIYSIANQFISLMNGRKMFAFYGDMGAGKTTFIRAIMEGMNVEDNTSSPTFSIVNEYFSVNYGKIYHFDFYRIKNEIEAFDIGVEELFEEDGYCFIEWPERIENLLPENCVKVDITDENNCRIIKFQL